jgi:uncharacterized membrane protein YbhN (UPF0104 family)
MTDIAGALEAFLQHLAPVHWSALGLAVVCHLAKILLRARAWRKILAASYPDAALRWRDVLGAYAAGTGGNAILPARGGAALKLFLVHRRIEGASYTTLAATLLVETLFDAVVATALLLWALRQGVLPGLDVLPTLPADAWLGTFPNAGAAVVLGVMLPALGFALGVAAARRIGRLRRRAADGLSILRSPLQYLCGVVPWQAASWVFRLLSVVFFLKAFGIEPTATNALLVQVTESFSTMLPLTPAGMGTEQALLVYALRGEAPASALLGFSVGMKLVLITVNLLAAGIAVGLLMRTLAFRRIVGPGAAVVSTTGTS